ncbi:amidohydrolase family protein, partial [Myxococcota bacterium]|nr:amidohydrolase family protein [Myxococcota bacterium]
MRLFEKDVGEQVDELQQKLLSTGFHDSHLHLKNIGWNLLGLDLTGSLSLEELVSQTAEHVAKSQPGLFITGRGYDESLMPRALSPTRHDLDRIAPHNPLLLYRVDGHAAVANTAALRLAGLNDDTLLSGGQLLKDQDGHLNGILIDNAISLVESHIPPLSQASLQEALLA